jgi:hypothetical protein
MSDLDRIVQVTITRQTASPSVESFNDVLVVGEFLAAKTTPAFSTRTREYGSLAEMAAEGWVAGDAHYDAAEAIFSQSPSISKIVVGRKLTGADGSETWTEALTAIALVSNTWYGIIALTRTLAHQQLIAAWVETNKKLAVLASADSNVISGTGDIAEYVETQGYDRTAVLYHSSADLTGDEFPDAAWIGKMFPGDPGESNWMFKTLTGITPDAFTTAQRNTVLGKNGNIYSSVAGISMTEKGTVGSGEYLDVIWGLDYMSANIQNKVFSLLVNSAKVPFTDAGIQGVVAKVKEALQEAVAIGLITAEFEVSAPLASAVSSADKSARTLKDITFTATLQGAVNAVQIEGVVVL